MSALRGPTRVIAAAATGGISESFRLAGRGLESGVRALTPKIPGSPKSDKDEAQTAAAETAAQRAQAALQRQRRATLLTGGGGLTSDPLVSQATLLGGR